MFIFVIRKIIAKPWLPLVLFIITVLTVSMVSTVPMYTNGILTRLLVLDLQEFQRQSYSFPGAVSIRSEFRLPDAAETRFAVYRELDAAISDQLDGLLPAVPILSRTRILTRQFFRVVPAHLTEAAAPRVFGDVVAMPGIEDHVTMLHGRLPLATDDGIFEVMLTAQAMVDLGLVLNNEYTVRDGLEDDARRVGIRPVGVFQQTDSRDTFWQMGSAFLRESVVMNYEQFVEKFIVVDDGTLFRADWFWALDYHRFRADDVAHILTRYEEAYLQGRQSGIQIRLPVQRILETYQERREQLNLLLWMILAPTLLLLVFLLSTVASTFLDHEREEIAVLKSRGASAPQVFSAYVIFAVMLVIPAAALAPTLALVFCHVLGAADGFLEFVNRKRLAFEITPESYSAAIGAAVGAAAVLVFPAIKASRYSIVEHKRNRFRSDGLKAFARVFMDVSLLGIAGFGLYQFQARRTVLQATGAEAMVIGMDPILFISSTSFLLGMGMVVLRLYPIVIRAVFNLGREHWGPIAHASLIHVSRNSARTRSLMLFLIVSLGTGVFNADSARTLNTHAEDRERYMAGAPVSLLERWDTVQVVGGGDAMDGMGSAAVATSAGGGDRQPSRYLEPDYRRYALLETVDLYTKVLRRDRAAARPAVGNPVGNVTVLAVVPHEFGAVAFSRRDLLPHHINSYLNLLAHSPQAAIVNPELMAELRLEPGDAIQVRVPDQPDIEVVVYAQAAYWPSFNPFANRFAGSAPTGSSAGASSRTRNHLVVMNLNYYQAMTSLEPYEVWLRPRQGVDSAMLYDDLSRARIYPTVLRDANQSILRAKNEPMLLGMNGAFTFSFLMSMGVSLAGFLVYWSFAIRERNLQFGVFRAMGLSRSTIMGIIGMEQLLVTGTAVVLGLAIGSLGSRLYVPLLEVADSAAQQVLPFRVVSLPDDRLRILAAVGLMIGTGIMMLVGVVARLRIHEAVKLGEE